MANWDDYIAREYEDEREETGGFGYEDDEDGEGEVGYGDSEEDGGNFTAGFADTQRTSRGRIGTEAANLGGRLGIAQRAAKSPIQRFIERFSIEFMTLDNDPVKLDDAKELLESMERAEFLSPSYAAAAIHFVFRKQSKGGKYQNLNSEDSKLIKEYTKRGLGLIDFIRYIRIFELAITMKK